MELTPEQYRSLHPRLLVQRATSLPLDRSGPYNVTKEEL